MVHKTTLMLDDAKLRRARKVLGTKGIRDTIDRALDEVLAVDARRRLVERLRTMKGLDLDNAEVMAGAWR
jgi:Arc/MetJ family transcription regulator